MEIRMLSAGEISRNLFADFIRRQRVDECRCLENGAWVIRSVPSVEDWKEADYTALIRRLKTICATGIVLGAFIGDGLKGFAAVEGIPFGNDDEYLELSHLYVSADCRGQGLGAMLFRRAANWAAGQGAKKLYFSAHPSVETQAFCHAMDLHDAADPALTKTNEHDVPMEFELKNCHKSKDRAQEVLRHHLHCLEARCGSIVASVVLVGSLADDSYTGNAGSDIDVIHILRDDAPEDGRQRVLDAIARTEEETGNDIPLARCVYRYRDLFRPYPTDFDLTLENLDYMELPVEVMRIKDGGRTVFGEDLRAAIDHPQKEDIIASNRMVKTWEKRERAAAGGQLSDSLAWPLRMKVQAVLARALLDYYFATGKSCSSKNAIAANMRRDVPHYRFLDLVERCTRWRCHPDAFTPEDEAAVLDEFQTWANAWKDQPIDYVPYQETT